MALITVVAVAGCVVWLVRRALRRDNGEEDPDEPMVVAGPGAHMEIEVMRAKLEAFGIPAYARNRQGPIMPGGVPPQLWGWEVLVRRRDVGAAEDALFGIETSPTSDET